MAARYGLPQSPRSAAGDRRLATRMGHFLATDPEGSFVADEDGAVVGLSQSLVREGYWMLSLLATATGSAASRGGTRSAGARSWQRPTRQSGHHPVVRDPAAMALYTLAGFSLHPALTTSGRVRPGAVDADPRVRHGGPDDFALVDEIDRRGAGICSQVWTSQPCSPSPATGSSSSKAAGTRSFKMTASITMGARDEERAVGLLRSALAEMAPTRLGRGRLAHRQPAVGHPHGGVRRIETESLWRRHGPGHGAPAISLHPLGRLRLSGAQPGARPAKLSRRV